jgi:hypothetical protein
MDPITSLVQNIRALRLRSVVYLPYSAHVCPARPHNQLESPAHVYSIILYFPIE